MAPGRLDDVRADGAARRLLWAAILASFVAFLDASIVTVALPAVARDLGGGVVLQQWVVSGYLLSLSALILVAGALSDRFGRLRVLRVALVAFAVTSFCCAVAPTAGTLVAARVAQGVAGALLVPGSLSLIIAVFDGQAQARAIGRWTAWTSVSALVGPVTGGVLVDALGWRSVFVLALVPAAAAMLLLGRSRDGAAVEGGGIDVASAVLTALGLALATSGLIELGGSAHPGRPPLPADAALTAAGAVLLVAFVLRNRHAANPLVPPELFAARNFTAGNLATLVIYAGLGFASVLPSLYLQQVARLPATVAAAAGLPATVLLVLLSGRFGALAARFGPRRFMTAGPLVAAAGALVVASVGAPEAALAVVVPGSAIVGLGLAMTVAPLTAAVLGAVPPGRSGVGSAVNNAVARVGGLVATACLGLVLGGAIDTAGFRRGEVAVALLLAVGAATSWVGIRDVRPAPPG